MWVVVLQEKMADLLEKHKEEDDALKETTAGLPLKVKVSSDTSWDNQSFLSDFFNTFLLWFLRCRMWSLGNFL